MNSDVGMGMEQQQEPEPDLPMRVYLRRGDWPEPDEGWELHTSETEVLQNANDGETIGVYALVEIRQARVTRALELV